MRAMGQHGGDKEGGKRVCSDGERPRCTDGSDAEKGQDGKPFCPSDNDAPPNTCADGEEP